MPENELKIIEVKQNIFAENENVANELRKHLKRRKNIHGQPDGFARCRKTTILLRTIEMLKDEMKIGVMEADIDAASTPKRSLPPHEIDSASYRRHVPYGCG